MKDLKRIKYGRLTMRRKTLGTVLGLVIGLNGCGTSTESPQKHETAAQVQPGQENYLAISGHVEDIDEDSFGVYIRVGNAGGAGGFEYQFETLQVKSLEEKVYRLLHRGPSSYKPGDKINFSVELLPSRRISYKDIIGNEWSYIIGNGWSYIQEGSIEVDGTIR